MLASGYPALIGVRLFTFVQGVANRDIKLENALLDSNPRPLLKICDFGYSKVLLHHCENKVHDAARGGCGHLRAAHRRQAVY